MISRESVYIGMPVLYMGYPHKGLALEGVVISFNDNVVTIEWENSSSPVTYQYHLLRSTKFEVIIDYEKMRDNKIELLCL